MLQERWVGYPYESLIFLKINTKKMFYNLNYNLKRMKRFSNKFNS